MKRLFTFIVIFFVCFLPLTVHAEIPEQMIGRFEPGKRYQVIEDAYFYYIQCASHFHDAQARQSLVLLSKVALLKHIQKADQKVTGLDIQSFQIQQYYEKNGLLYALSSVNKMQVKVSYSAPVISKNPDKPFKDEIQRLEAVEPKTKEIHEQLKDLYFFLGDLDNYNKQSDILLEILFNEN